jgi:uncharacterized phage protein (predicted DNA packaging)
MEENQLITVQDVKAWCRIDSDDEDAILQLMIAAASAEAIAYTGLILTADNTPAVLRQAIAVRAADLYANREGQLKGSATFHALLAPYRVVV